MRSRPAHPGSPGWQPADRSADLGWDHV